MNSKFELLLDDTVEYLGIKLFRIRALISFGNVEAGDIGGYIEKEDNLSIYGKAWVSGDAWVYGDARVYGDAEVYGDARVYGDALVYGDARVYRDWETDRKSTRLNSSHEIPSRMPSSA